MVLKATEYCGVVHIGPEFVILKIAMEMTCDMHYKLRMMGVPIAGLTNMFVFEM